MVVAEANAIGTAYLQADYLPEPAAEELKELIRQYLPLRIADDPSAIQGNIQRSVALHAEMWAVLAEAARSGYSPDLVSALGDAQSEIVAVSQARIVAGLYARVPDTVLLLLLAGSAVSLGMVGYMAGLKRRRSVLSAVVMVVALGVVLTIVIDLDRPAEGSLEVSQQALRDVQAWVGPPSR